MDEEPAADLLALLQRRTETLVTQRLRSVSAVIARLCELIGQAHELGHSHAAIHARLRAAGLAVSWNNYRAGLVRARRRALGTAPAANGRAPDAETGPPSGSPTQLLDALASAQRAAARDYAQAARADARKPRSRP